ncbi:MAG TPA: PrsW family intramembrane metalloprotease [Actinomycetota bacterium]|nr:PrsW family intramembrane metalloprotease [Actinomycetota bacterium]
MDILGSPSFLITFAVLQIVVFLALVRLIDPYEHEPFSVLALMAAWGAVGATALSATLSGPVKEPLSDAVRTVFGAAIAAPLVEELAKGIALVAVFVVSAWAHRRFGTSPLRGLTDGIVYGAAIGLGFAFTEDIHYLVTSRDSNQGFTEFATRQGFLGTGMLLHAIYAAAFGACLGVAVWARRWISRIALAFGGVVVAMSLHAINNGLVQFLFVQRYGLERVARITRRGSWSRVDPDLLSTANVVVDVVNGVVVAAFVVGILIWLRHQRKVIRDELPAEVDAGLIDYRDWELVPHYVRRLQWYWTLIRVGELERCRIARRLHVELANLALLKWWSRSASGEDQEMATTRQRIATLKAAQAVDVYAPTAASDRSS